MVEATNHRLQRVDARGRFLNQWPIPPGYARDGPHLAMTEDGSIFMTESQSASLLRYSPDGTLLDRWETIGPVTLAAPVGLYVDARLSRLYITDVWTHQVHVFEMTADR